MVSRRIRFCDYILPPANEVWEGYVFTHVCQSFCSHVGGGVCPSACWDYLPRTRGRPPPRSRGRQPHPRAEADTPPHEPQADPPPPVQCMMGDTGNKRAVRILLECILIGNICFRWLLATWTTFLPMDSKFPNWVIGSMGSFWILCDSVYRRFCPGGSLSGKPPCCTVKGGRYASY